MKEEGEITDDDDDNQVVDIVKPAVAEKEVPSGAYKYTPKRGSYQHRRSVNVPGIMQRSSASRKIRDRMSTAAQKTTISALEKSSASAINETNDGLQVHPDSSTSVPPVTSESSVTHLMSSPLLPVSQPQSQIKLTGKTFSNERHETSHSCNAENRKDEEIISISDSDMDVSDDDVIMLEVKQDDDDLDELLLYRDALMSVVRSKKNQKKMCKGEDCFVTPEYQHSGEIDVSSISKVPNLLDIHHHNGSVEESLSASDSVDVSGVVPVSASNGHLISSRPNLLEDLTILSIMNQQSAATSSDSLSHVKLQALPYIDSAAINSVVMSDPTSPVCQAVNQTDVDNFEEVEMDLDSGNESDNAIASYFEQSSSEWTTNATDQNFFQNQYTGTLVSSASSAITSTTDSVHPLMSVYCSTDTTISQSSVLCPITDGSNNMTESHLSKTATVCSGHDEKIPALMTMKTEIVDTGISSKVQQQRNIKNADKKELLLRAAVLQSLSSKRQQQQSQSDKASHVPRHKLNITKQQVMTQSSKRTVTSTANNELTVRLPVPIHHPVVISLTGESSESDNEEHLDIADSSNHSRTMVLSSSAAMSNNLDKFLREMRRATDGPKSQDSDTVPLNQDMAASVGKFEEKHSTSESASANQYTAAPSSVMNNRVMSGNKGISSSAHLNTRDNSLQKIALCNIERKISYEKRKLQHQRVVLSKTKLKMARKKEQISAAEKRIKKLQEQLAAAEKITASNKTQLNTLHEEMLTLCHGIEQCQTTITRLEADLLTAQTNLENTSDLENLSSLGISSAYPQLQLSSTAAHGKCGINVVESAGSCRIHSDATTGQNDPAIYTTTADALKPRLVSSIESLRNSSPVIMTEKANMSHRVNKLKNFHSIGVCESENNMAPMKDTVVRIEQASAVKHDEVGGSHMLEQIASHTVISPFSDVIGKQTVMQGSSLVAHSLNVIKLDKVTQQNSVGTSVSNFAVASGETGSSSKYSASLDELLMPSDKKIRQIMQHYKSSLDNDSSASLFAPSCQLFISDPVFSFQFPVSAASSVIGNALAAEAKSDALKIGDTYKPYHSSLLSFRSYRFSDFYHQREGLSVSSETFSHKLDCRIPLCQFDLMGKCLDDNCPWQHKSDYSLSEREQLVDIVSYCPSVTDICNSTPISMYETMLNQYTDKFLNDSYAHLSHPEQCSHLIDRIKTTAGSTYPHAVFTSARRWKLHGPMQRSTKSDRSELLFSSDDVTGMSLQESTGEDVRYWMVAESDQIKKLEDAVIDRPTDDSLWIKLAYAKMTELKWCESHDECISYGLNILTRAVEANPSNSRLWSHYLDLYMQRSNAGSDVSVLYEQAVEYAPSYEFFWKYLQLPASYSQKMNISKRLRQYLCSPRCFDDADTRSHHLLETVLYQAALCTMSGRLKDGLQVIQAIVQSKASVIWLTLTPCDRIVIWLSFIHLYECRQLPSVLFDPANSNPGPIVRKEPFVVPFRMSVKSRISYKTLTQLFQSALSACDKEMTAGTELHNYGSLWLAALRRSRILLELSHHGLLAGRQLCEEILRQRPHLIDIWLCLVQLTVASSGSSTEDPAVSSSSISTTVERAVTSNPHTVTLYLAGISALIECGDSEAALSFAERCAISLYEVEQLDATSVDPNLLYGCLLGQPVPPNYKVPVLHSSVSRQYIADQQANLWISYCLLLDLQGAHDQATQAYHLALSCLTKAEDIRRLWLAFLRRNKAVICQQLPWLSPAHGFDQKRMLWQQFESDTHQALVSLPVRCCLPHSSHVWDDYSCHNQIIQMYVSCLSDKDIIQQAYEKFIQHMPGNVELQLTSVRYLLDQDMLQFCHGMCLMALHSCPRAALLWNMCLRSSEGTANVGLKRALYAQATTMLPFSASLWKQYIMFEVINKSREHVKEALDKCRRVQVNVASFVDSLLK